MSEPPDIERRVLRRRTAWLAAAAVVARAALAEPGRDVRQLASSEARAAAEADAASLVVPTANAGELTNVAATGLGAEVYQDVTFLARESELGRAIVAGRPVLVDRILPWATDHDDPPNPLRLGPAMLLPLHGAGGGNAALVLSRTTDRAAFDPAEPGYAAPFADLLELALRYEGERVDVAAGQALIALDRAVRALHDDLTQRLFAVGVGLQGVIDLGGDQEVRDRLRGYVGELDEMIGMLRVGADGRDGRVDRDGRDGSGDTDGAAAEGAQRRG